VKKYYITDSGMNYVMDLPKSAGLARYEKLLVLFSLDVSKGYTPIDLYVNGVDSDALDFLVKNRLVGTSNKRRTWK